MRSIISALAILCAFVASSAVGTAAPSPSIHSLSPVASIPACPQTPIHCDAVIARSNAGFHGYSPAQLRQAYNLPADATTPQTVGVVLWGSYDSLNSDLAAFDARNNLPACSQANGCVTVVNEQGNASPLPGSQESEIEYSLDIETIHGICPSCHILVVEASAPSDTNLGTAENTAVRLGATEVNNSWGGAEDSGISHNPNNKAFDHPGVAILASSGDSNYGAQWPADIPSVISVGGTTLYTNADGSYGYESVWSSGMDGTGSGCSGYLSAGAWQTFVPNWNLTQCGAFRGIADISAVGDPATGTQVYSQGSWLTVGGTSLSSPLLASVIALAGGMSNVRYPASVPYGHQTDGSFHDVLLGSNGPCGIMCKAGRGYDGPTGIGSVDNTTGFLHTHCLWWRHGHPGFCREWTKN